MSSITRRIWITGASSGIGEALVKELANDDTEIWISSRSLTKLSSIAEGLPGKVHPLPIDLSQYECVEQLKQTFENQVLDQIYLIAGGCEYVDFPDFDSRMLGRIMNQNYMSHAYAIEAALPSLRQSVRPWIVGMSSSVAWTGLPRSEAYGSSKAAIYYLMESLRVDLWGEIDVSVICPGFVETPLTDLNDFPMPGRITSEAAAQRIARASLSRPFEIHFPKRFTYFLKLLSILPQWLKDRLKQGMKQKPTEVKPQEVRSQEVKPNEVNPNEPELSQTRGVE